jgi:alanine racemase
MKLAWLRKAMKPKLHSLNTIEIHGEQLLENLKFLSEINTSQAVFPVLKSNAYGHGIELVSKVLSKTDVPYICVDSFPEYQVVRDYSKHKALIL